MLTVTERRITYAYGPKGSPRAYKGHAQDECDWDRLILRIEDEMWGAPYEIVRREERVISYGEWEDASE